MEISEQIWWYTARAAGLVALGGLTLSVVWGLILSTRILGRRAPAPWIFELHRFVSLVTVVFVGVHIAALVPDNYVHFGWAEIFVPGASEWKPGAVAWGIVAFYLLVAVQVSSMLMRRIPRRWWRLIHFASFALWAFTIVHVITAGTDTGSKAFAWVAVGAVQLVLFLTIVRIMTAARLRRALRASSSFGADRETEFPSAGPAPSADRAPARR
ncbi:MAG: hypothetical protein HKN26_04145 [Acidimicrobiales bacterium]|nr:hypothetical protein [Acidimicrobiales bacterium]